MGCSSSVVDPNAANSLRRQSANNVSSSQIVNTPCSKINTPVSISIPNDVLSVASTGNVEGDRTPLPTTTHRTDSRASMPSSAGTAVSLYPALFEQRRSSADDNEKKAAAVGGGDDFAGSLRLTSRSLELNQAVIDELDDTDARAKVW